MRTLQDKVENLYMLDRDQKLYLDIATYEIRNKMSKGIKFLATNEFTRRRYKTTALLIQAVEMKTDVLVRYHHNKDQVERTLEKWQEELGIEHVPTVHVLSENLRGKKFENGLLSDELYNVKSEDIEHVLYQIQFGFIDQETLIRLHKEGLL